MPSNSGLNPEDDAEEKRLRAQASAYKRLTGEQESQLLAQRGSSTAIEDLVDHNLDLVVNQAEAHAGAGVSFPDLFQEGSVGLLDAVAAFDGRGKFRQFASLHIGLQMDSLVQRETDARSEDQQMIDDCRALDLTEAMLRRDNGHDPTDDEIARALSWDLERVRRVVVALDLAREQNDAATLNFLEPSDSDELGIDFEDFAEPEKDPRRRLPGHGPDD